MFSAGVVALLQMFSIGLYGGEENQSTIIATALSQDRMESIRNTAYGSIINEARAAVTGYTFFQREVVVTTPQANLKQVTVNVYWTEKSGDVSVSLVTYVSNI